MIINRKTLEDLLKEVRAMEDAAGTCRGNNDIDFGRETGYGYVGDMIEDILKKG